MKGRKVNDRKWGLKDEWSSGVKLDGKYSLGSRSL
jgi:hypothetical protein